MQRIAFQTVLRETAGLAGFTLAQLTTSPRTMFRTFINRRVREHWQHWWWNQLMHAELRRYRADYDATTAYATGAEVYYPTESKYYRALQATTGNAPTNATYWEEATTIDPYIELEQAGEEAIGTVRQLSPDNPLENYQPRQQPFRLIGEKIQVLGSNVPASVYVWFREPAPTFLGDDYDAETAYAAGRTLYYTGTGADYEGDFWITQAVTVAGQTPESTPASFTRIAFPSWLRESVAQAAYADWLRQDGGTEAAAIEDSRARQLLFQAQHRDGPAQRQILHSAGI